MMNGRPMPVFLDLPSNVIAAQVEEEDLDDRREEEGERRPAQGCDSAARPEREQREGVERPREGEHQVTVQVSRAPGVESLAVGVAVDEEQVDEREAQEAGDPSGADPKGVMQATCGVVGGGVAQDDQEGQEAEAVVVVHPVEDQVGFVTEVFRLEE